jgi:hypothetical protein
MMMNDGLRKKAQVTRRDKMTVVRRSVSSDSIFQPENEEDENSDRMRGRHRRQCVRLLRQKGCYGPICLVFQVVVFFALLWYPTSKKRGIPASAVGLRASEKKGGMISPQAGQLQQEQCTLPTTPRPRKQWSTNPILVPGYPSYFAESRGTANGDIIQPLIQHLTGLEQGARNFHASLKTKNRSLKRCHTEQAETITCSQVHPIIDISPEKHQKLFDSHVVVALQNFARAFPMGASVKANRYSNTVGQMNVETWRKTRDLYIEEAFGSWKSVITTWKSGYDYYKISMYLPYEHLMDAVKGPRLIQRLAQQLQSAGFNTVNVTATTAITDDLDQADTAAAAASSSSSTSLQCIWKRSIQDAIKFERAYIKYQPAYTAKQRDFMLEQMQQFIDEIQRAATNKDNVGVELITILQEYHDEIREVIPIEEEEQVDGLVATTTA